MKKTAIKHLALAILFLLAACQGSKESAKHSHSPSPTIKEEAETRDMSYKSRVKKGKTNMSFSDMKKDIPREHNTEEYDKINENAFKIPQLNPLSTFSIDVDAASYSNSRRMINNGQMPYKDAVRIEEFINYFNYDYPSPSGEDPFEVVTEVAACPWNTKHQLVHIGLQGKKLDLKNLAATNLVFLIDASGSMESTNKLPLLKSSLKLLLEQMGENDRIAIVAYAGAAGLVLPSTPAT